VFKANSDPVSSILILSVSSSMVARVSMKISSRSSPKSISSTLAPRLSSTDVAASAGLGPFFVLRGEGTQICFGATRFRLCQPELSPDNAMIQYPNHGHPGLA
jgi:hypothetical protein